MTRNVLFLILAAVAFVGIAATGHHSLLAYFATGALVFGTITATQVTTGDLPSNDRQSWQVVATADADTASGAVAHVMGVNPMLTITPLSAEAALSGWYVITLNSTQWAIRKSTQTGSGATTNQVTVDVRRRD